LVINTWLDGAGGRRKLVEERRDDLLDVVGNAMSLSQQLLGPRER